MRTRILLVVLAIMQSSALTRSRGEEINFLRHDINPDSRYAACAAVDVNRDGRLDILSGGSWYEAPDWKQHFVHDVELIRGRFDEYSNLPLDVNGDGWTDIVCCNYRSQSIYWVEHPGLPQGAWSKTIAARPGPMETGRLADIDGDGKLDVLPNGTKFAAWWEIVLNKTSDRDENDPAGPTWIRHDLPQEVAGHGIGFGDVDGDGRGDLVGSRGWLQAPGDRRKDRWLWQPEFRLQRDASIPIVVHDADSDGDSDIVWGRGHNSGVYWLEQTTDENGARIWTQHAIDTSWSQPHSLLLADMDNDGQADVVAGKRYLGHDGKDPGEFDPLVIYWYKFQPTDRTWQRQVVSPAGPVGFGLDPKAVDIDADGDTDILAGDRCGLYLLENLLVRKDNQHATESPNAPPEYEDHSKLMVIASTEGKVRSVESQADWGLRRHHILLGMQQVMGPLPDSSQRPPLALEIYEETDTEAYVRKKITYTSTQGDRVPAYLLIPNGDSEERPAMLCLHPTSPLGKAQICGLAGKPSRFYAHELAEHGFVCLAPDYPSMGEQANYVFQADNFESGTMKAVWDNVRAIDLLESLPEVDGDRIGVIGHSLGGHNALFTAPFDMRIKAVVTSCGFTAFHDYYGGQLKNWAQDKYMPRIGELYGNNPNRVPFDFHEVLGAIAPRPIFVSAPLKDHNFANDGVRKTIAAAQEVYALQGAPENLHVQYPDCEHDFPEDVRQECYEWLARQLQP